jgi:signal peptidase I
MSDKAAVASMGWLRALWGGLLSLPWPGLGQIYAGWWWLGIVLFVLFTAFDMSLLSLTWLAQPTPAVVAVGIALVVIPRLVVTVDAVRRVRSRWVAGPRPWYRSTWLAAVVVVAVTLGIQSAAVADFPPGWQGFHAASESNMPTLLANDYFLADVRHPGALPDYGDVIVFRQPGNAKVVYVKRVVGLPGDLVQMRDGVLYLNDKPMPREALRPAVSFHNALTGTTFREYRESLPNGRSYRIIQGAAGTPPTSELFKVPPQALFVMGDNRDNSLDSRYKQFGYVPTAGVIGVAETIYWTGDWMTEPGRLLARVQ